ncbi:MAG: 5'/3'-nucleotidase SurE [Halobacteriales archaeon]
MTEEPSILLTNDDGIDAPGIAVLADELVEVADVTVLAPLENKSGVGRIRSWDDVVIEEHELGHAVHGTPVDCVVTGVVALETDFDLVVSGINAGPNVGAHVLGRSGTVGAAIEAGFLGLPAIAASMYDPKELPPGSPSHGDFEVAAAAIRFLVERLTDGGLATLTDQVAIEDAAGPDYLNVNAPADRKNPPMRLTRPSTSYGLRGTVTETTVEFEDAFWEGIRTGEVEDPVGTDRRAVVDREVSVSPLTAPRPSFDPGGELIEEFRAGEVIEQLRG